MQVFRGKAGMKDGAGLFVCTDRGHFMVLLPST